MKSTYQFLSLISLSILALTGCEKQEPPKPEPKAETKQEIAVPEKQEPSIQCDDIAIKNSLGRTLLEQLSEQVDGVVSNYPNAKTLNLHRRTEQRLSEVQLDLQNLKEKNGICHAEVVAIIPVVDSTYAEQYYKAKKLPSLNEQLATAGLDPMGDNRIIVPISYRLDNNQADIESGAENLAVIANIMSASAYQMAKSANLDTKPNTVSVKPITSEIARPQVKPRPQPEPQLEPKTTKTTQQTPNDNDNNVNNNENEAPKPKNSQKNETTKKSETKKPESASEPIDNNSEITIVETDEQY